MDIDSSMMVSALLKGGRLRCLVQAGKPASAKLAGSLDTGSTGYAPSSA